MRALWRTTRAWLDRNFTTKGLMGLLLFLYSFIPDSIARSDYWKQRAHTIFAFLLTPSGRVALLIAGIITIWLDHRSRAKEVSAINREKLQAQDARTDNSKLIVHSANYRAWKQGGKTFDVTEFLQKIIAGDYLVIGPIENHSFVLDGKNYVPTDPYPYEPKRLQVTYSHDGEDARTVERGEHGRLVLPEDSEIEVLKKERDTFKDAATSAIEVSRRLQEKLAEVSAQAPKVDALAEALKQIADTDAEKMSERVREIGQRLEFHFVHGADPSIDVITELCNGSVFDLVNFGEVSGHATYAGRQIAADPRIIVSVEPPVLSLKHGQKLVFTVRQYLSSEMADLMQANRDRGVVIDFGNVMVTFKVLRLPGCSLNRFLWSGPRFAIEDTTRV